MAGYAARRLLQGIPVLIGVSILVFAMIHMVPGDPAQALAGEHSSLEAQKQVRERYGLDDPLPVQYLRFVGRAVVGDLGNSIFSNRPVTSDLARYFPGTIELSLAAMLLATVMGIALGIASGCRPGSWLDTGGMVVALAGVCIPVFVLGYILIALFGGDLPYAGRMSESVRAEWSPSSGFVLLESLFTGHWRAFVDALRHLLLPALALSTIPMAVTARVTRAGMVEALGRDFVRTAKAKGLSRWSVVLKHTLKNALLPIVTILGLQAGYLLAGAVLTETIFAWPGLGRYAVESIARRDFPAVQATVLLFAVTFVGVNLLTDLLYGVLDPRVRRRTGVA